ncbi:MAG: rhodanese-like domain-containing protein [Solirubrobacterales bacterium]
MATQIAADRVTELVDDGAQLVEVLPRGEYEEQRLPGAINVPLKELDAEAVAGLDRETAVIVYCWDSI